MRKITLYTDGACSGNPGPGGYAAILVDDLTGNTKYIKEGEPRTTNNRMELMGAIAGLSLLKYPCEVRLFSDSKYLVDALKLGWAGKWQKNGWMRTKTEPAKNPDLWQKLLELTEMHSVTYHWVKGHADDENNNLCDRMAVEMRDKYAKESAEH